MRKKERKKREVDLHLRGSILETLSQIILGADLTFLCIHQIP